MLHGAIFIVSCKLSARLGRIFRDTLPVADIALALRIDAAAETVEESFDKLTLGDGNDEVLLLIDCWVVF